MPGRRVLIAILFTLTSCAFARASDEAELPLYFSGLREQGLFRVAEEYALARLADSDATPIQKAILAVELSKVFASHAAEARSTAEADELWTRAEEALVPLAADKENPRWGAVRTRQASLLCDRAMTEFWKHRLDPDSESQRVKAIDATQSALTSLRAAVVEVQQYSKAPRPGAPKGQPRTAPIEKSPVGLGLSKVEARHLSDEVDFLIVRMDLNLVHLFPIGVERAAALIEADTGSTALSRQVSSDFVWPARLARIETIRLQGDPEKAFTYAKSLLTPELSRTLTDSLIAEQARAKLAMKAPADAIQLILDYGQSEPVPPDPGQVAGQLSPELRTIAIECLLASVEAAQDKADKALVDDLWKQATEQQKLVSGSWRSYVDALLSRSAETRQYGEQLASIVREGRLAAQRRDWPTAASAYEQAASAATADGKLALAAEFTLTQASIEIEAGQFERASRLLSAYPTQFPGDPRAAEAHLLGTWTLGKLLEAQPTAARRQGYLAELQAHLSQFPNSPTCVEAHWSLTVDAIRHEEWGHAIDRLESIPLEHSRASDAAAQLPFCFERELSLCTEQAELRTWEQRAESALSRQYGTWPKPPAGWSLSQSENALRWARVLLRFQDRKYSAAEELLSHILQSRDIEAREMARDGSPLSPAWARLVSSVTQLRIISLAGLGRMGEAEKLFSTATTASAEDLLGILSGLSELASSLDSQASRDLGRVQLAAARRLHAERSNLAPEIALRVDRCLAEAYVATDDLPEAIAIYESLLKTRPRDRQLLETIGTLSLKRGQPIDHKRAKGVYRQLESVDPAGSPAWLRTRLTVARICHQLGENAESAKLLKVTRLLYPTLGGEDLQSQYSALEKEVARGK